MRWTAVTEGIESEEGIRAAASLFTVGGLATVLVAGIHGIATDNAAILVTSVMTMIGYTIVGWVLTRRRRNAPYLVSLGVLFTVFFSMWIIGANVAPAVGWLPATVAAFPAFSILVVVSGGFVVASQLAARHPSLTLDLEEGDLIYLLLQGSVVALVWSSFAMVALPGGAAGPIAFAALLGVYAATAGHLADARRSPHHILAGSALALLGNASYIFQYSNMPRESLLTLAGQGVAVVGMLLAAFPTALAVVAIHDMRSEAPDEEASSTEEAVGADVE